MKGHLLMSEKERFRKGVFDAVVSGGISLQRASELLGLSYRQCKRSCKRFREEGAAGLVHRSRGRVSNRRLDPAFKARAVSRYQEAYEGFGATLASEKLSEEGLVVSPETLRRWLLGAGVLKRRRKRKGYRSRRERRPRFGELVQMDGSHHDWFGKLHGKACLINMVDDATGITMSLMAEEETTVACMKQLWQWIENFGIPQALYTDRKSVFATNREPTLEEQLAGITPKTAFGKVCDKLGIEIIEANSPQAKGRVERNHAVYQDRFVKELALQGVTTIEEANNVLARGFVDGLNKRFARPPASCEDGHLPLPADLDLADVFCFEEARIVQNDWVVRHDNIHYQIGSENKPLPKPKDKVLVRTRLDGAVYIIHKEKPLSYRVLGQEPASPGAGRKAIPEKKAAPSRGKNPSDTPWRQGVILMFAESKKK